MKLDDLSPAARAFVGTFVTLRKMRFAADDIFLELGMSARFRVFSAFATLKTQGKSFSIELGSVSDRGERVQREYAELAASMGALSEAELELAMLESEAWRDKIQLMMALQAKGIRIPVARTT